MTDDTTLQPAVAAEYLALADVLASASEADWNTSSLCEGWRVRELIAHLTMPARYDQEAFMAELRARNFDFGRLSNEIATRDAQLATDDLVANLRADALLHWAPPEGGYHGALNHVVIHGLDVTVPLGVQRRPSDETMRVVLDDLTEGSVHAHFGTVITGRRLKAIDLDWSYGSGPGLRGAAGDLALVLCGRRSRPDGSKASPLISSLLGDEHTPVSRDRIPADRRRIAENAGTEAAIWRSRGPRFQSDDLRRPRSPSHGTPGYITCGSSEDQG